MKTTNHTSANLHTINKQICRLHNSALFFLHVSTSYAHYLPILESIKTKNLVQVQFSYILLCQKLMDIKPAEVAAAFKGHIYIDIST